MMIIWLKYLSIPKIKPLVCNLKIHELKKRIILSQQVPLLEEQHRWACGCPSKWQSSSEQLPTCGFGTLPKSNQQSLIDKTNTNTWVISYHQETSVVG
jgi:hypothetical protein